MISTTNMSKLRKSFCFSSNKRICILNYIKITIFFY